MAAINFVPPLAWDCHVHCFDPDEFPFKPTRTYTPQPARAAQMLVSVLTQRVVLVQATIEDGPSGLLRQLARVGRDHPERMLRGIILADSVPGRGLHTGPEFDRMHEVGVRCVRVHGSHGGSGDDVEWAYSQILQASRLYPLKRLGWAISAQFPLKTWAGLADRLLRVERRDNSDGNDENDELATVNIIADHNACAASADTGSVELGAVVRLVRQSARFYIKLGAFYRREPRDIHRMRPLVELFTSAASDHLLWGSDWPHVDATQKGLDPSPHLQGVSAAEELRVLESWLSADDFIKLLVQNPARIFG